MGSVGVLLSVVECCGVCWLVTSTPKKSLVISKKVTPNSKKSNKKKSDFFCLFFWIHFVTKMLIRCSINSKKSYFCPKKSKKSKKVKKVKKNIFFIFRILCKKKSHLYIHFWF